MEGRWKPVHEKWEKSANMNRKTFGSRIWSGLNKVVGGVKAAASSKNKSKELIRSTKHSSYQEDNAGTGSNGTYTSRLNNRNTAMGRIPNGKSTSKGVYCHPSKSLPYDKNSKNKR